MMIDLTICAFYYGPYLTSLTYIIHLHFEFLQIIVSTDHSTYENLETDAKFGIFPISIDIPQWHLLMHLHNLVYLLKAPLQKKKVAADSPVLHFQ